MAVTAELQLDDSRLTKLEQLIRESFRVRENETPVYVDVAGNLDRVALKQHQIIFGRRGSGKSCLLVYYRHTRAPGDSIHTSYVSADTIKTLEYPDVLLRLLLAIFQGLPPVTLAARVRRRLTRERDAIAEIIKELRDLLALPSESKLKETTGTTVDTRDSTGARVGAEGIGLEATREATEARTKEQIRESDDRKVRVIENRLADYKAAIQERIKVAKPSTAAFIVDDFYLIDGAVQPDVIDYVHRLLRDTDLYFKIATIRHRTRLLRTAPLHVGIQIQQDVDGFNLDQTLEDLDQTGTYLGTMLRQLGVQVGIDDVLSIMSDEANKDLVLLAGGVPRDYLNIFVGGLARARATPNRRRVTPTDLRRSAAALSDETKLKDLRQDAGTEIPALEALFVDVVRFCLTEKRKTAFLISLEQKAEYPEAHELIQQLMDFKLIHLVEPITSAASGRPGRYEAYTLDFALFMEPRKRNIEIVRFWETDDQRRRVRLREAPIYDLKRATDAIARDVGARAEQAIELAQQVEPDPNQDELRLFE